MLQPKRTKFRKQHKGKNNGIAVRGSSVSFGEFGLKSVSRGQRHVKLNRVALRFHVTLNVVVKFGFAFSLTNQLPKNR